MAKKQAATSTASGGAGASKSSILRSSFAPSSLQLRLFASVIQSFESQQLRIHDTSTGRLRCQHAAKPGQRITCLDWGQSQPLSNGTPSKKNKKQENALLAYGTSTSEICLFAPTEGRVVGELTGQHERGISDFRFSQANPKHGYSLGGDGKLVQWDLNTKKALRTVSLPEANITTLAPVILSSSILCASTVPYLVFPESQGDIQPQSFDAMKNSIRALYRSPPSADADEMFLATDGDRYVNIYDTGKRRLARTLIASSEIMSIHLDAGDVELAGEREQQVLAVVNKDGAVELFPKPFVTPSSTKGDLKSSRKSLTQKPGAQIRLTESSKRQAPVYAASVQGPEVVIASVDGGVNISFQKVRWQDEGSGELLFSGLKEVPRVKSAAIAASNGVKDTGKPHVDESNVVVSNGVGLPGSQDAAIEIESSEEDDENDQEDEEADSADDADADVDADADAASDASDSDADMQDAPPVTSDTLGAATTSDPANSAEPTAPDSEPTFADRLAALHPNTTTISVPTSSAALHPLTAGGHLSLPTGLSLSTVLTQSLRTNDAPLLEACLHTTDQSIIRNTLTRLDPGLASLLIQKLAERIVSRPGRYGGLQVWVQHLCVAHGASISQNGAARESLKGLYRALEARASGLQGLLVLKGKLQMVEGQLRFRREIAAQRAEMGGGGGAGPGQGRAVNVMVEGAAGNWDSEDEYDEAVDVAAKPRAKKARKSLDALVAANAAKDSGGEEDEDEDMPLALTNGVGSDDSDNEEHSSDEEDVRQRPGALVDDEAEDEDDDDASGFGEGSDLDSDGEDSEEGDDGDEDEEDSEMDSFINDGEISVEGDDALLDDAAPSDDEDEVEEKPKLKRRKN